MATDGTRMKHRFGCIGGEVVFHFRGKKVGVTMLGRECWERQRFGDLIDTRWLQGVIGQLSGVRCHWSVEAASRTISEHMYTIWTQCDQEKFLSQRGFFTAEDAEGRGGRTEILPQIDADERRFSGGWAAQRRARFLTGWIGPLRLMRSRFAADVSLGRLRRAGRLLALVRLRGGGGLRA